MITLCSINLLTWTQPQNRDLHQMPGGSGAGLLRGGGCWKILRQVTRTCDIPHKHDIPVLAERKLLRQHLPQSDQQISQISIPFITCWDAVKWDIDKTRSTTEEELKVRIRTTFTSFNKNVKERKLVGDSKFTWRQWLKPTLMF